MFKRCEVCGGRMGAAVGRECDGCKGRHRLAQRRRVSAKPEDATGAQDAKAELPAPEVEAGDDGGFVAGGEAGLAAHLDACPTCGRPYPLSAAERSRRYREKQKELARKAKEAGL